MSESSVFMKCPACGAVNRVDRDQNCWVCEQPLDQKKSVWLEFYEDQKVPTPSDGFNAGGLLFVGVFLMVALGLVFAAPGLGILLIVFSIIPLIRTLHLVDPYKNPGKAFSLYITSVFVSVVIVIVLGVVAFGAFCLSLFGVCSLNPRGPGSEFLAMAVLWGVPLLAVILTGIPIVKWVIRRYQHDKEESRHHPDQ